MSAYNPNPRAGGFPLIAAMFAGTVLGALRGQPVAGFLIGTAAGVALAVGLWLWDRSRD